MMEGKREGVLSRGRENSGIGFEYITELKRVW